MTPTLLGRWQTRIFLFFVVGGLVTLPFALGWIGPGGIVFWLVLFSVCLFGLAWDALYHLVQQFFWDHDWPGVLQLFAAIVEAVFLALVWVLVGLPGISRDAFNPFWFLVHYSAVWIAIYLLSWVVMRLFFPRWRFRGGQWL